MSSSSELSTTFKLLPKNIRDLISQDQLEDPSEVPAFAFSADKTNFKAPVRGTMFKSDQGSAATPEPAAEVINNEPQGALSRFAASAVAAEKEPEPSGALSRTARASYQPIDMAEMLQRFVPQDDSSNKYLAMAAALGKPTNFGTFGERMANVADALMTQKQNQEKLRAQYTPLIMQQVAAQQSREEQAAYRLEAQQAQQQARLEAQQAQQEAQRQAVTLAQQQRLDLAAQNQAAISERAAADRASREEIARDRAAAAAEAKRAAEKAPSGYEWGPTDTDGKRTQYPVKGGPADAKTEAKNALKLAGETSVNEAVATLRDAYDRLEKGNGITSTDAEPLSNLGASISASGAGQSVGKMFGTQNQSARNDVAMTRPVLLAALMKATGMTSSQINSDAELKLWLATATDTTLDVQANRRALDAIERKYLSGSALPPNAPRPPGLPSADAIAAERARRAALRGN